MEANTLDSIRHQINAGDQRGARIALLDLLAAEPDNADAWALMAILLADPAEQAQCYREILRINPHDRHAKVWLESLTGQQAEPPAGMQLPSQGSPGTQPAQEEDNLDEILEGVVLPGTEDGVPPPVPARGPVRRQAKPKGFLDGLLGRFQGGASDPDPEAETLVLGSDEAHLAAGAFSPELILRLAGGPLPPEERRDCPKCGAVVSRREAKCPWCSVPFPDAEGQ